MEASELLELSNKVQCEHYRTSGNVCCYYGRSLVHANRNPVVEKQTQRSVQQKFELLTTPAFLLITRPTRGIKRCTSTEQQERGKAIDALRN